MTRLPFRIALVAVIAPFTIAVIGVALQLAWLPDLPATIATHWGPTGEPDSFGPSWTMPLLLGVLGGLFFPALFGVLLGRTIQKAGPTVIQKFLAVTSLFVGTLLSIIVTSSVAIQRGLPVGSSSQAILPVFAIAVGAGLLLAVLGWFVMPRAIAGVSATANTSAPVVPVAPGETVVWIGHAHFATWVLILLCGVVAVATAIVVFVIALRGAWPLAIVPVVLALAILGTASWHVRVDGRGLTVRPTLGWPMYRVALADVASAGTTDVVPLGEFGGFGLRWGLSGRVGIITRGGEALEVERRNGRAIVVTVDDAATAAGLLTALAAQKQKS
jgi:hypothetical protein